ncbi:MAG: FAD-binding protein [Candidatus Eisenbacteria bacterium]|nr:FAD-binding protein [Candidatus Eisenbacteria bacterium]
MSEFAGHLRARLRGEVRTDRLGRGLYATDASVYRITPVAVAIPLDEEDVVAAVRTAAEEGIPVIPRGAGTSLGGQVTGEALVLDLSKHLNRLVETDPEGHWARVQPGLVRDELTVLLAARRLHFAPDPATSNRASIGGMIGNNSSGMRSLVFGKTVDHVLEARVLLADGEIVTLRKLAPEEAARAAVAGGREGELVGGLRRIVRENGDAIRARFPKVMRRVAGYCLDELLDPTDWNPAKLMAGSEGTLGVLLDAKIRLEPLPRHTALAVAHYGSLDAALRAVPAVLRHHPSAVEVLDGTVIDRARTSPSTASLCDFLEGTPRAILIVEFLDENGESACRRARDFAAETLRAGPAEACPVRETREEQARVWEVRRAGLGLVTSIRGNRKPIPFIEDACVPVEHLAEYIERIDRVCRERGTRSVLYGHASVGVLHVRPLLDLHRPEDVETMKTISRAAFDLIRGYGGSWSGEHGDGLVRSAYLEEFFGPEVYGAFREVKRLFDPENRMNPGKIVDAPPMDRNLRAGGRPRPEAPVTVYHYRSAGGFLEAVELCVGVGACRKTGVGTMCPSYIATRDEDHSTRGRANALQLALAGELGPEALDGDDLEGVLDLCLSCKSCKTECPSGVDMAKLKGEFLQRYRDRHGTALRDRIVAFSPRAAALASGPLAPIVNAAQRNPLFRLLLERFAGLDRRRVAPAYARRPFPEWFRRRRGRSGGRVVALFDDTYMNYHEPRVGVAAVELLESCGYEVVLARAGCCQRPRISHGFLRDAKREGERTLRNLDRLVRDGIPVVVCEPGCASALLDDLPDLMDDAALAERIVAGVHPIDVFLDNEVREGRIEGAWTARAEKIWIHGHCHQKALFGTESMKRILALAPGARTREIDSGCCGMAGSFGYEKEHYELSMRVGEDRLFPALRGLPEDAVIVACGFSCRHQIADASGRRAVHWVETVRGPAL